MDGIATDALVRPTSGKNEAVVCSIVGTVLHLTQYRKRLIGQRHFEVTFLLDLHPLGWDRPELLVVIDLGPFRTPSLLQSDASQDQETEHKCSSQSRPLPYRHQLGIKRGELTIGQRCDLDRLPCPLGARRQKALQSCPCCRIAFVVRTVQDTFDQCAKLDAFAIGRSSPDWSQHIGDFLSRDPINWPLHQWPGM